MLGQSERVVQIREAVNNLPPITISLDSLLAEVSGVVEEEKRMKQLRKSLAGVEVTAEGKPKFLDEPRDAGGLTPTQRMNLRAQLLTWEARTEWSPQAFVAVEQVDHCVACNSIEGHIVGVYQFQLKTSDPKVKRFVLWAPEEATDKILPRTFMSMERSVAMCTKCLWQQGWTEKYEGEVKP